MAVEPRHARSDRGGPPIATPIFRAPGGAPDLARLPLGLNFGAISLIEGIRAALSVAVIMAVSEILQWPVLHESALAALLTCLCDPGGPIRRRIPVLIGFAIAGAIVTVLGGLVRDVDLGSGLWGAPWDTPWNAPWAVLPFGVVCLFGLSFARVYGQAQLQLGALLSVVLLLSFDPPRHAADDTWLVAMAFAGGALWATVLTLAIWPVYPFHQARLAVGRAYVTLAALTLDLRRLTRDAIPSGETPAAETRAGQTWATHARVHRRAVRDALEAANLAVMDTLRARGANSPRATQSLIRLGAADQVFGALLALSDLLERGSPAQGAAAERVLRRLRPVLSELGRVIAQDGVPDDVRIERALVRMEHDLDRLPADDPLRLAVSRINERVRIALTLSLPRNFFPGAGAGGSTAGWWQGLIEPVRANLTWRSAGLRHAVRAGVTGGMALAITLLWPSTYGHWLTITVVATMQPSIGLTLARSIERVVGTAAGGCLAALVGAVCTTPMTIAAAMFPLAVVALSLRAVSLGLFMVALTPLIVLLVEVGAPGEAGWTIALARAGFTTLGGVMALAASYLLWPDRPAAVLSRAVVATIDAHRAYAQAQISRLLRQDTPAEVARARRLAGQASNALETAISQALIEPLRRRDPSLEAVLVADAALRRLAGRIAAMTLDRELTVADPAIDLSAWRDWIGRSLQVLTHGGHELAPRPQGAGSDSLRRIARQIELMAGVMERIAESGNHAATRA